MNAPAPLVTIRGLEKRFPNGTLALRELNMTIKDGEFLSLLGPSGCGKSTVLRMVAGLSQPSAGEIQLRPQSGDAGDSTDRVAFVFQEPTLMPWANVIRNVMLPLRIVGTPKAEAVERAREALAGVGLTGFEESYPRELSGGMKMRVSIARAIVTRPKVLLLDEPFAALDEITRLKLNNDLLDLWDKQRFTAIFVTHSVPEAVYLSQRILVMAARPGRVSCEYAVDGFDGRQTSDFRLSDDFQHHVRNVSLHLGEAMAA